MKNLIIFLLFILANCSLPKTSENLGNKDSITKTIKPSPVQYKLIDDLKLTGDFDGDGRIDTLVQNNISNITNLSIDSIPDSEWDTIVDYLYQKHSDVILTSSIESLDTLHLGTGLGLNCLINIGDNNNDKKDEVALVIDYCDFSRVNSCKLYSICKNKWIQLDQFGIYEGAFDFQGNKIPIYNSIPGFLERKNGHWIYLDYLKNEYETQEEVGKMKRIKLKSCN